MARASRALGAMRARRLASGLTPRLAIQPQRGGATAEPVPLAESFNGQTRRAPKQLSLITTEAMGAYRFTSPYRPMPCRS